MAEPDRVLSAHEKYGLPLTFTGEGAELMTGGFDGTVSRWSLDHWATIATTQAHEQSVNCGAITVDEHLITGSSDTTIRVWSPDLAECRATLEGHKKTVADVAAHPSAATVASASYDTTVRVWQLTTGADPLILRGHSRNVTSVAFVDNGNFLVSGGVGDELIVWSLDSEGEVTRLTGHGDAVAGISTADDQHLWSVGYNGTVTQWSREDWSGETRFELPEGMTPSGIAVNPRTETLAISRDHGVTILEVMGSIIQDHETAIKGLYRPRWSPDGKRLYVGGADGNIRVYEGPSAMITR